MRLDLSSPLPEDGIRVRLRISFPKWTVWPLAFLTNNLHPLLHLYDDSLETRVVWKVRHLYTGIALAEAYAPYRSDAPSVLQVTWTGERFQFLGRLVKAENLATVLHFLADKGVPLGPAAQALLDADAAL